MRSCRPHKTSPLAEVRLSILALLLVALSSCGEASDAGPRQRIVLLSIDTLRHDTVFGKDGRPGAMPLTEAWAEKGVIVDRLYTSTATTLPSHVSMLTGLHPWQHGLAKNGQILDDRHLTVAEILQEEGFETNAIVASAPLHGRFGTAQGFDTFHDEFTHNPERKTTVGGADLRGDNFYSLAGSITEKTLEALDTDSRRQFLWIHFFDLHSPYGDTDPEQMKTKKQIQNISERKTRKAIDLVRRLYDLDAGDLDRRLDELIRRLVSEPDVETSIVFVADHGESLGEDFILGHGMHLTEVALRVPCFILGPDLSPRRIPAVAGSIDIAQTLLGLADVDRPEVPGHDLLANPGEAGATFAYGMRRVYEDPIEDRRMDGSVHPLASRLFYVVREGELLAGNAEGLLDVNGQPARTGDTALTGELKLLFDRFSKELDGQVTEELVDPATQKALEALGYTR